MKKETLTYLLQNPLEIDFDQTRALHELIQEYPYFQAAHALRLKGLKSSNSLHYNTALKLTAAHTTDRGVLFDFITSEEFNQNAVADSIKEQEQYQKNIPVFETEEVTGEKRSKDLNQALKMKMKESEQVFDPELFRKQEAPERKLELGRPLQFSKKENHSFTEWLRLTSATPIERPEEEKEEPTSKTSRKFELINQFISKNPKISPAKNTKKINLAEESVASPEALMTETLARVYLEQKNYKQAIQAYKILILKNPEKSGFFADQIRAIEKLQENNNTQ